MFRSGEIVFARTGASVGKSYLYDPVDGQLVYAGFLINIAPDPKQLNPKFLALFAQTKEYWDWIARTSVRSGQPGVNGREYATLLVPLPNITTQDAIAEAIGDLDQFIRSLERLIAKKQAIKQGMMQQLLTGRTRLPGFTDEWRLCRFGELLAYEQPGRYLVSSADYAGTGTPVLTAGKTFLLGHTAERHGVFKKLPVIIFDDFTTASKYVDFSFKAKSSAMKMLSARPGVHLRYIYERMQLIDFVPIDHKRRWIAEYSQIEVAVPDDQEQQQIASVLDDATAEIRLLEGRLTKARDIKAGMMQQLLTGRTRLPVEAAS